MFVKFLVTCGVFALAELAVSDDSAHGQYSAQFQSSEMDALGSMNYSAQAEAPGDELKSYAANLTESEHLTNWAKARADDTKWGYRLYRTYYPDDDDDNSEWQVVITTFQDIVIASLQDDAEYDGLNRDPHHVRDRTHFDLVNDASGDLSGASFDAVRKQFQQYVLKDHQGSKLGGFEWGGYYKLNIGQSVDGMALNQALVIDEGSYYSLLGYNPEQTVYNAEKGEAPPYVVAVDACYDSETFTPMTSWTQEYQGWYSVPVELLMLDFYEATYEARPMEYFAPKSDESLNMFGMSWASTEVTGDNNDEIPFQDF